MNENELENQVEQLHVIVRGRVQGVGFRYFVQETAYQLGLFGWVRNRWDGSVEVLAEGKHTLLQNFLKYLRRGPRSSRVTDVDTQWCHATGEFKDFRVRMTGD